LGKLAPMPTSLVLDPSRPCQVGDDLLALWLPRGRGRDALADGLIATVDVCENPACRCTIARLHAVRIDDRAEKVVRTDDGMRITWRNPSDDPPRPEGSAGLTVDFLTGAVEARDGGNLPAEVARYFEEPLPFSVLDHFWARWSKPRRPLGVDWKAQALEVWEPGVLLSTMEVFPEERLDCYLVDGKLYQVDTMFCVEPDCDCTDTRLSVLAFSDDRKQATEVGGAWLPVETMMPAGFEGEGLKHETFVRIYLEWRRRNVPAKDRLLELRDLTRRRGLELHKLVAARSRPAERSRPAPPVRPATSTSRPGRNDPCPCGSGKKYKRCCGR
jgi:hypothetical protein